MTRISLDGEGTPIPTEALPTFAESALPPVLITFTEDTVFNVEEYRTLGFTHFEVMCVGASGGRGGDAAKSVDWVKVIDARQTLSDSDWNLYLDYIREQDAISAGHYDHLYSFGDSQQRTARQMAEHRWVDRNPFAREIVIDALLQSSNEAMGGGGGGGGLHKASGALADLPDTVPIVVGQAGEDAGYGQVVQNGPWTPWPHFIHPTPDTYYETLWKYFDDKFKTYPAPHKSFDNPANGEDGGASTFNVDVCRASGGKGGLAGKIWDAATSKFINRGWGGDGGSGDSVVAGGGAAGSTTSSNGADGSWDGEIGKGGGGGRGGNVVTTPTGGGGVTTTTTPATAGGRGSYGFADTSVFGERQFRSGFRAITRAFQAIASTYRYRQGNPSDMTISIIPEERLDGNYTETLGSASSSLVVPGSGGGARVTPSLKYGSKASGFNPNGVVALRLVQIAE